MESDETVIKFPSLSDLDRQFIELERQRDLIKEQAKQMRKIRTHLKDPLEYP